ncbi:MAG: hypothetical protein ABIU09_08395 [Pyrinomonadaceae bacterium]
MNELDEMWSQMLSQALENAKASGRHDVAEYLNLKAANDALRQAGVRWLLDTLITIAGEANRTNLSVSIERDDTHNFSFRGSNLVGSQIRLCHGVRCLTVEAGWTRTPSDGFMRGGALAIGRITHKGMPKANAEISLIRSAEAPMWQLMLETKEVEIFRSETLRHHFSVFTQD